MAKDKKGKSEGKKLKIAEKKQKQEKKGEKKEKTKGVKANDSDAEEVDLDVVLAEYAKKQELFLKVTETTCDSPKPRSSSTIIGSPASSNELLLFGGEYFDGAVATFFNDLYIYLIDKDEWREVKSQNTPLPRSGHAWTRGGNAGGVYLFGGEFSSPKQGVFYHYQDFYRLEPATREWTKIETKKGPPARSGHRMTYYKNYIILYGGFQDTAQETKYLSDLWLYDTQNFIWHSPNLPPASQKPDPRSSFTFLPHESGAVVYGGYSRIKTVVMAGKKTKGGGGVSQRNILKPLVHTDCWFLRISQPNAGSQPGTAPSVRWERRKKPANAPNPPRAGATMAFHKGRGISFGGVHDVEESDESIDSEFFNSLWTWNIERNRYFPLTLRKPRTANKRQQGPERGGGRRGRGQANEEELLRNLAALETGKSIADADKMAIDTPIVDDKVSDRIIKPMALEFPHARFGAQLAVQEDVLFIYGGTFEKNDREYTFDEMYAVDLGKLDGVKEIFRREPANWLGSDDEDSEDEDISDDEDDEDEDEEAEDDEGDTVMSTTAEKSKYQESSRKSKSQSKDVASETDVMVSTALPLIPDEEIESTSTTTVEDHLPHPRPFESRRDFFQRTTNEWQEALMTKLRWKGIQPESLAVKEIKTKAFEMSEEKWWDCREEITVLEDEQDEAGIGEVITLADKNDGGGTSRRR